MGVLKWRTSALLSCPSRMRSAPWKPMERTSKKEEGYSYAVCLAKVLLVMFPQCQASKGLEG